MRISLHCCALMFHRFVGRVANGVVTPTFNFYRMAAPTRTMRVLSIMMLSTADGMGAVVSVTILG